MATNSATRGEKRPYNSARRLRQAAQTRADVVAAATKLFGQQGWAATLAAIADEAGVSVETIYNGFGSKKALLRAALDVAVVGDAEPIPLAERPEFAALGEGDVAERIRRGVALNAGIQERSAGVWRAVVEAAGSDDEVEAWRREVEAGRRLDIRRGVERILDREIDESMVSLVWVLYSPEAYNKLVVDAGFSRAEYEELMVDATTRLVASLD